MHAFLHEVFLNGLSRGVVALLHSLRGRKSSMSRPYHRVTGYCGIWAFSKVESATIGESGEVGSIPVISVKKREISNEVPLRDCACIFCWRFAIGDFHDSGCAFGQ
jgi:uncharacterized membrane protein YuzA (DUF378 family)